MAMFTVQSMVTNKTTRVRCETKEHAALRGAIKLGVRGYGNKPSMVVRSSRDSSIYHTYYWLAGSNANSNIYHDVLVTE